MLSQQKQNKNKETKYSLKEMVGLERASKQASYLKRKKKKKL